MGRSSLNSFMMFLQNAETFTALFDSVGVYGLAVMRNIRWLSNLDLADVGLSSKRKFQICEKFSRRI